MKDTEQDESKLKRELDRKPAFSGVSWGLSCGLFCLGIWISGHALAWNGAGHRLVAYLAWTRLSPQSQQQCAQLLRHHPDYARWAESVGQGTQRSAMIFSEASTWADEIRRDGRFHGTGEAETPPLLGFPDMLRHTHWHYADTSSSEEEHLYTALPRLYGMLADTHRSPHARAYALVWLIHLLGDAHQPLHNGFRNDRGGNEFEVIVFGREKNRTMNLHSFWDELPGPTDLRGIRLIRTAEALVNGKKMPLEARPDFLRWQAENLRLSYQFSYPDSTVAPAVLSTRFIERAQQITRKQLQVAGGRLALVIEMALRGFAGHSPTPFEPNSQR